MKKPALTIDTGMIHNRAYSNDMFAKIQKQHPGVKLGYVGTAPNGDMYFQEFGNNTPFILSK